MSQNKELPLVVCSVDGALLGQHGRLLACDELTIRLYCAMGGRFSALTYRTPQGLETLFPGKNRIGPSVCCGGSLVYSPASGLVTYAARLEEGAARAAVRDALDQFPEVSAQIIHANGNVYVPRGNPYLHAHLREESIGCIMAELEDISAPLGAGALPRKHGSRSPAGSLSERAQLCGLCPARHSARVPGDEPGRGHAAGGVFAALRLAEGAAGGCYVYCVRPGGSSGYGIGRKESGGCGCPG